MNVHDCKSILQHYLQRSWNIVKMFILKERKFWVQLPLYGFGNFPVKVHVFPNSSSLTSSSRQILCAFVSFLRVTSKQLSQWLWHSSLQTILGSWPQGPNVNWKDRNFRIVTFLKFLGSEQISHSKMKSTTSLSFFFTSSPKECTRVSQICTFLSNLKNYVDHNFFPLFRIKVLQKSKVWKILSIFWPGLTRPKFYYITHLCEIKLWGPSIIT